MVTETVHGPTDGPDGRKLDEVVADTEDKVESARRRGRWPWRLWARKDPRVVEAQLFDPLGVEIKSKTQATWTTETVVQRADDAK